MAGYGGYIRNVGFERGQSGHDAHLPIGDYEASRLHVASGRPKLQAFPELIFYFLAGLLGRNLSYRWQNLSGCVICVHGTGLCDGFLFPQIGGTLEVVGFWETLILVDVIRRAPDDKYPDV